MDIQQIICVNPSSNNIELISKTISRIYNIELISKTISRIYAY